MAWKVGSWKDEPARARKPAIAHIYGAFGHLPRISPFDLDQHRTYRIGEPVPKAMLAKKRTRPVTPPLDDHTSQYQIPQALDQYAILWTQSKEHKAG